MNRRTRRARAAASLAAVASVVTALIPLTAVFSPNWFAAALVAAVAVPAVGAAGRLVHNGLAILAQVAVAFAIAWWRFPGGLAGGLLPWDGAWALPGVLATARDEVLTGVVPVAVGAPLDFLLVCATALLAVVVDQLAVAARLPLVATLPLVAVFVAPQLAVPRGDDLLLALPFALALLALFAAGSAPRRRRARGGRGSAMPAATIGVAIVSALATLAIAPAVPILPAGQQGLVTRPLSIDVSLDLGDDLRNTSSAEVLRVRTDAAQAPYLRLATHTGYGDDGWQVDAGASSPIAEGFPELSTNGVVGEVESRSTSTWVSDVQLEAAYLPVPENAVALEGASDGWNAMLDNRTVRSSELSSRGEAYRVDATTLAPTREQLDASPWAEAGLDAQAGNTIQVDPATGEVVTEDIPMYAAAVPDEVSGGVIGDTARSVTQGAGTPYRAALQLQEWLRSSEFSYSLETPVEDGFDGSDAQAVERFLDVREGYCVHFASTYALMARSLGIPTRVAVGYLPGTMTGDRVDDMVQYSVAADRLHAWPEVYLVGIGWMPFDPTPGIAQAQSVVRGDTAEQTAAPEPSEAPSASAEPSATPSATASNPATADDGSGDSGADAGGVLLTLGVAALVILLLCAPAAWRRILAGSRRRAADAGDIGAAWRELVAVALDAGLDPSPAESPRALGARLVAAGAGRDDVGAVVDAVERAAFAPAPPGPRALADPLRAIARALRPEDAVARFGRSLLPRSLWTRPRLVRAPSDG